MNSKYIIRKNQEFEYLINNGKCIKNKYFVIYNKDRKENHNRYGISVSKKVGNAVTRNKIKRRIKDILMKNVIKNEKDYVIIIRKAIINLEYNEIRDNLLELIKGE